MIKLIVSIFMLYNGVQGEAPVASLHHEKSFDSVAECQAFKDSDEGKQDFQDLKDVFATRYDMSKLAFEQECHGAGQEI